jgi:hypothetical protein
MDDGEERRPKEYTLVYGEDGKLYAVGKHGSVAIEDADSPVPPDKLREVKTLIDQHDTNVTSKLEPYLPAGPAGSGVRVRAPKILD